MASNFDLNSFDNDDINTLMSGMNDLDTWRLKLEGYMWGQRNALGLSQNNKFPFGAYQGELARSAPLDPFSNNLQITPAVSGTLKGIQAAIDHWAHGKAPVNAADFLNVSLATGVPVDLMIAQAVNESTIGTNGSRPLKTLNIFNVGNVDSGGNRYMPSWIQGMFVYANLIKNSYAPDPKHITAESVILPKFVRVKNGTKSGDRYASNPHYETELISIVNTIRTIIAKY